MRVGLTPSWPRALLLGAGVGLRLLSFDVVADPEESRFSDMRYYADVGEKISRGEDLDSYEKHYMPLGLSYTYAGIRRLGLDPLLALPLLHITLDMLSCLLVAHLAGVLVSPEVATLALGAACLYPPFIFQSGFLLTETPFLFLGLCTFYWLVMVLLDGRSPLLRGLCCGLAFALAVLFKSMLWLLVPVALAASLVWTSVRWPRRFVVGAVCGWLAIVGLTRPGTERLSLRTTNRAVANTAINLYLGRTYSRYIVTSDHERQRWVHNTAPALYFKNKNPPIVVNHSPLDGWFFLRQTVEYVKEHPSTLVTYSAEHVLDLLGLAPYWPLVETRLGWVDLPLRVSVVLLVIAPALLGLGSVPGGSRRVLISLPLAVCLIVAMVFFGAPRYRLPFDGYVLILAAAWYHGGLKRVRAPVHHSGSWDGI